MSVINRACSVDPCINMPPWSWVPYKYFIAFAVAHWACVRSFNFVGQKFWIFRSEVGPVPEADAG
jgi:hypothetical protein